MVELHSKIKTSIDKLRKKNPVVLCVTNNVTVNFVANTLLALGASPIMSSNKDEAEELISISDALYVNIGTLSPYSFESIVFMVNCAKKANKPIVLDPVGAGGTKLKKELCQAIVDKTSIIKGNASEILALYDSNYKNLKGVDSTAKTEDVLEQAKHLANTYKNTIIITGKTDVITNGKMVQELSFGSDYMTLVTGMGCALGAVVAAFSTIGNDYEASIIASAYFSLCGSLSRAKTDKLGDFAVEFISNLHSPNWETIKELIDK